MNLKKIISSFAIVGALAALLATGTMAAGANKIYLAVDKTTVAPGEDVTVSVIATEMVPYYLMQTIMTYEGTWEESNLTFNSAYPARTNILIDDAYKGWTGRAKYTWVDSKEFTLDGEIASMTLTVPADAEEKEYTLGLTFEADQVNQYDGYAYDPSEGDDLLTMEGCTITVAAAKTAVTGVTLDQSTLSLEVGGTATLTATVEPSDATDTSVTWSSDNADVATVDQKGKVTAKAAGTANITVTTTDGSKTATCAVTVTEPTPAGPTASATTFVKAAEKLGGQATVYSNVTVNPTNANNLNVKITKGDKTQTYNIPLEFDVETSFIAIVKTRVAGTYTLKICDGDDVLVTAPSFEVTDADLQ